jgi:hypothetical protein
VVFEHSEAPAETAPKETKNAFAAILANNNFFSNLMIGA